MQAVNGLMILSGPILANEEHPLLESVTAMHGVKSIENWLELHEQAGDPTGSSRRTTAARRRFRRLEG